MTRTAPGGEAGARLTGSQAISLVHLISTVSDTCQVWHGMASLPTHEELLWNSLIVTQRKVKRLETAAINKPRQFLYSLMVITAHRGHSHITFVCMILCTFFVGEGGRMDMGSGKYIPQLRESF